MTAAKVRELLEIIKTNCSNMNWATFRYIKAENSNRLVGRLVTKKNSMVAVNLAGLPKVVRRIMLHGSSIVAIDVVSCCASILHGIATKHRFWPPGQRHDYFDAYCANPHAWRQSVSEEMDLPLDEVKDMITAMMHGSNSLDEVQNDSEAMQNRWMRFLHLYQDVRFLLNDVAFPAVMRATEGDNLLLAAGDMRKIITQIIFTQETKIMRAAIDFCADEGLQPLGLVYDQVFVAGVPKGQENDKARAMGIAVSTEMGYPVKFHTEMMQMIQADRLVLAGECIEGMLTGGGTKSEMVTFFAYLVLRELQLQSCVRDLKLVYKPIPDMYLAFGAGEQVEEIVREVCGRHPANNRFPTMKEVVAALSQDSIRVPRVDFEATTTVAFTNGRVCFGVESDENAFIYAFWDNDMFKKQADEINDPRKLCTSRVFLTAFPHDDWNEAHEAKVNMDVPIWVNAFKFQGWADDTIRFFEACLFRLLFMKNVFDSSQTIILLSGESGAGKTSIMKLVQLLAGTRFACLKAHMSHFAVSSLDGAQPLWIPDLKPESVKGTCPASALQQMADGTTTTVETKYGQPKQVVFRSNVAIDSNHTTSQLFPGQVMQELDRRIISFMFRKQVEKVSPTHDSDVAAVAPAIFARLVISYNNIHAKMLANKCDLNGIRPPQVVRWAKASNTGGIRLVADFFESPPDELEIVYIPGHVEPLKSFYDAMDYYLELTEQVGLEYKDSMHLQIPERFALIMGAANRLSMCPACNFIANRCVCKPKCLNKDRRKKTGIVNLHVHYKKGTCLACPNGHVEAAILAKQIEEACQRAESYEESQVSIADTPKPNTPEAHSPVLFRSPPESPLVDETQQPLEDVLRHVIDQLDSQPREEEED